MTAGEPSTGIWWLIGAMVVAFLILLIVITVSLSRDFTRELRYIEMEIGRTEGSEQKYWRRRKRKLWLSLIPFVKY